MVETQGPCSPTESGGGAVFHSCSEMDPVDGKEMSMRAEIDTSAPFESVKEAVSRFGGIGFWKPSLHKFQKSAGVETELHDMDTVDISKLEEQAAELQKDLVLKERETLGVLKELDGTKAVIEELKSKLSKETFKAKETPGMNLQEDDNESTTVNEEDKENQHSNVIGSFSSCPASSAPGPILTELKQAKLNLTRTTSDLASIRALVESLTKKLEKERSYLDKTKERLSLNSSRMSNLEKELNDTRMKLQVAKDAETKITFDNPSDVSQPSSKAEDFNKLEQEARDDVSRAIAEVELTKARMKTVELRLVAARKMKQAARATEAVALSELKGLSASERMSGALSKDAAGVTLSYEEYSALTRKARDAEEHCEKKVVHALNQVNEADDSNLEVLRKVEKATEEVRSCKKALEEALCRVEAANKAKLGVEETLREWRAEHGQRRRSSVNSSTKFKHACGSQSRRDGHIVDVNGLNLVSDVYTPVLKPTLSIGQILSQKLQLPEDLEREMATGKGKGKLNMSLGQVLRKQTCDLKLDQKSDRESNRQLSGKRKKSGLARFSLFLVKESRRKNKPTLNLSFAVTHSAEKRDSSSRKRIPRITISV